MIEADTTPVAIIGYYNRQGYEIVALDSHGLITDELYQAGNNRWDSYQCALVGSSDACTLRELRSYCHQTGKEIANEMHLPFWGVERTEEIEAA